MTHENSFGIAYTCLTTTTYIAPSITQALYKPVRVQQSKLKPHLYDQQNQLHFHMTRSTTSEKHWAQDAIYESRELVDTKHSFPISSLKYLTLDTQCLKG